MIIFKILEQETRIQTLVEDSKNVRTVDTALDVTSSGSPVHRSVPVLESMQGSRFFIICHIHNHTGYNQ